MNNTKWMPYTDEEVEYLSKPLKPVKKYVSKKSRGAARQDDSPTTY